ncbi:MAG: hypothetical protein P4N59_31185 [Negativicutes bacterium]|nr:hypothetical protein [Negativicutes bacterium]
MPFQNNLTHKEKDYLEDALQMENLSITKCSVYADQCSDQEIQSLLMDIGKTKRQHANKLKQLLGQTSNQQFQ